MRHSVWQTWGTILCGDETWGVTLCGQGRGVRQCVQKIVCTAEKRSAQQRHSRDIFLNQKILPLDKLMNQQEGMLAYKVINGTYLLGDILTDRHDQDVLVSNLTNRK